MRKDPAKGKFYLNHHCTSLHRHRCIITSSVFEAKIGKPPDVAEADRVTETGEKEVELAGPVAALGVLVILKLNFCSLLTFLLLKICSTY